MKFVFVGPIIAITFNCKADATCIRLESFVINRLHLFITAAESGRLFALTIKTPGEFILVKIFSFNPSSSCPPNNNILAFSFSIKSFASAANFSGSHLLLIWFFNVAHPGWKPITRSASEIVMLFKYSAEKDSLALESGNSREDSSVKSLLSSFSTSLILVWTLCAESFSLTLILFKKPRFRLSLLRYFIPALFLAPAKKLIMLYSFLLDG